MELFKLEVTAKTGKEQLCINQKPIGYDLLDFWKWSASDLVSNATRGILAEFIVATALGIDLTKPRDEWGSYDLMTPEGVRIEVKCSAFLQSWAQTSQSSVIFSIKPARKWNESTHKYSEIIVRDSDVYVFCLLQHINKATVNPLEIEQWRFYVVSTKELFRLKGDQKTLTLKALEEITPSVPYHDIREAITIAMNNGLQ